MIREDLEAPDVTPTPSPMVEEAVEGDSVTEVVPESDVPGPADEPDTLRGGDTVA